MCGSVCLPLVFAATAVTGVYFFHSIVFLCVVFARAVSKEPTYIPEPPDEDGVNLLHSLQEKGASCVCVCVRRWNLLVPLSAS